MIRALIRLVSFMLLAYALGYAAFAVLLPRPAGDARTDAIVVLTGGPGRMERGLEMLRQGRAERMLVSGVNRTVRLSELKAQYPDYADLFDQRVVLGRESFDTRSNADEVARWMERRRFRSLRLVTNDLHMPRARYELRKRIDGDIGIVVDAVPTEPDFRAIFLEYNKYLLGRAADLIGI
ncbi:MAG: YdcF family protein [Sphingomonas sp.]|nr:YdcF family protein [Sphingomonas sp.]